MAPKKRTSYKRTSNISNENTPRKRESSKTQTNQNDQTTPKYLPGDVISTSLPIAHIVFKGSKSKYCDFCMIKSQNLKSCSQCEFMFYCNRDCQKKDWQIHKYECLIYKQFYKYIPSDSILMFLRLYLITKYYPQKEFEQISIPWLPPSTRCYNDLMTHKTQIDRSPRLMHNYSIIFSHVSNFNIGILDNNELFELYCRFIINSFSVVGPNYEEIGVSLYVAESALDHSCMPNSTLAFYGSRVEVRALKNIYPDEEITISYFNLKEPLRARRERLRSNCYFLCECSKCSTEKDGDIDYDKLNTILAAWNFCLRKPDNSQRSFEIGRQAIPIYHQIYGEYHTDITLMMFSICKQRLSAFGKLNDETMEFVKLTQNSIKITHGERHPLYLKLVDLIVQQDRYQKIFPKLTDDYFLKNFIQL